MENKTATLNLMNMGKPKEEISNCVFNHDSPIAHRVNNNQSPINHKNIEPKPILTNPV